MILRLLCLIPASVGAYNNISKASSLSTLSPDHSGLFETKSTPLIHNVALLWVKQIALFISSRFDKLTGLIIVYFSWLLELDLDYQHAEKMATSLRT
jgi:hypothetical protein